MAYVPGVTLGIVSCQTASPWESVGCGVGQVANSEGPVSGPLRAQSKLTMGRSVPAAVAFAVTVMLWPADTRWALTLRDRSKRPVAGRRVAVAVAACTAVAVGLGAVR